MIEYKTIDEQGQGEAVLIEDGNIGSKKLFLESYGCAMNFSDSEIVASILTKSGYSTTDKAEEADVILVNTCAIRDNAEQRVRARLRDFKKLKKSKPEMIVGVLGCMAERLKTQFLEEEQLIDIVVGPDSYRDLPNLLSQAEEGHRAVNVLLSKEETYSDIAPVRLSSNGVSAFISITRGCDNMCSFCVVPFTRGRERSRNPESIVAEAQDLFEKGYREVTLLGQNVDSYKYKAEASPNPSKGGDIDVSALNPPSGGRGALAFVSFAKLLEMVALVNPDLRVRFSTSHPKDMNDDVLHVIAKYENVCKYVHLPVQSGSSRVLDMMNRGYDRAWYLGRIASIKHIIPDCGISTDVISGFCSETEEEHQETLSLMEEVVYDFAYMFFYSERPKTLAERKYADDIPEEVKKRRLAEVIEIQRAHSAIRIKGMVGKTYRVLVEGISKKSNEMMMGRNSQNAVVVFPKENHKKGTYVSVFVDECTSTTLIGKVV